MAQDVLTPTQKKALTILSGEKLLRQYYLTGGTALAGFYLFHRASDDLDFFTREDVDQRSLFALLNRLKARLRARGMRYEHLYDRRLFFLRIGHEELKIEFTKYPSPQLQKPVLRNRIRVDSVRDIAANKLMALLDRFEPKDFVDLYFILEKRSMAVVRRDAEKKFGMKIGAILLGSELMKAQRITVLPKMKKPLTVAELKAFFLKLARSLESQVLAD